jgi:hypothetical protein
MERKHKTKRGELVTKRDGLNEKKGNGSFDGQTKRSVNKKANPITHIESNKKLNSAHSSHSSSQKKKYKKYDGILKCL